MFPSHDQEGVEERQDELFGHCNPKRVRVDNGYVALNNPDHFHKNRGLSQHYSHYLCMNQIRNIDDYDIIVRTRHDIMFNTDIMDQQIKLFQDVYDRKGLSGAGYYPDYGDQPFIDTYLDQPSHRGYSRYPSFDDWTIIAHKDHWSKWRVGETEFLELLEEMFNDPRNEHTSASYDVDGVKKMVCIPELVWYNLSNLNLEEEFTVAKGFVYAARPSLKGIVNKHFTQYTPADLQYALKRGWQNGGAVLQYSIML